MYVAENWDYLFEQGEGKVAPLQATEDAKVVDKGDRPRDHYGDFIQGESECWMIFQVGDRFFKKTGHQSSYGEERDWSWGRLTEVFPKTKTITVWE